MTTWCLGALLGGPWLGALLLSLAKRRERQSGRIALLAVLVAAVALLALIPSWRSGREVALSRPWLPSMGVAFALRLDALSLPFVLNVLLVSLVAVVYGWGYWHADGRLHQCYALLLAFVGSMIGALLADDVFLFFIFWEAMLAASSLLLAGWGDGERVAQITLKYFLYTQAGSLLILSALLVLVAHSGSCSLQAIAAGWATLAPGQATRLTILLLLGFSVKLAVFPFHTWLPDAHSIAPMPVTILLAAAMLSMGAYGILRFPCQVLHAAGMPGLQLFLMVMALASQAHGALMCLAARDIKRLVAYSSVSQMGYVLFGLASLSAQGAAGGIYHIINHGILKALLFMGVGLIIKATGRRQIEELGGLSRLMPPVMAGLAVGAIALAGAPPFAGFHSEWLLFSAGLSTSYPVLGYLTLLAPLATAAYALWFVLRLAFGAAPAGLLCREGHPAMLRPFYALAVLALLAGLYPGPFYVLVGRAAAVVLGGR